MKFLLIFLVFYSAQLGEAINKQYAETTMSALNKCQRNYRVNQTFLKEIARLAPRDKPNVRCMLSCFMKEMGWFNNFGLNLAKMTSDNSKKWENKDHVAKADLVVKECYNKVIKRGIENECDLSFETITCFGRGLARVGVSPPDFNV